MSVAEPPPDTPTAKPSLAPLGGAAGQTQREVPKETVFAVTDLAVSYGQALALSSVSLDI